MMPESEALQILNVAVGASETEITEKYEKYFKQNQPANGGSFYLQCKIIGAKNTLLASKEEEAKSNKE